MTDILDLPGWKVTGTRREDGEYLIDAEYTIQPDSCQKCGVVGNLYRHGTKPVNYIDSPLRGEPTRLVAKVQRYKCRENPGLYRAHFKKRQQLKRNAMPAWADEAAIKAIYDECQRISKETGVLHHVDHYYPLKNELVCGLHVAHNLRIITAQANLSKGNSLPSEES